MLLLLLWQYKNNENEGILDVNILNFYIITEMYSNL